MAGIKLRQVTKKYGSLNVLNSIDLDVADGEFLTLVGPSGCGKSTTLRIIAGLETQTTGDVEIDGALVNEVRPSLRDLAMVFQSYALYPHLTYIFFVGQHLCSGLEACTLFLLLLQSFRFGNFVVVQLLALGFQICNLLQQLLASVQFFPVSWCGSCEAGLPDVWHLVPIGS